MIRFDQPSDYRFRGRTVFVNPDDVMKIVQSEETYSHCVITLRNGDAFTVDMMASDAAKKVNNAKEAP